MCDDPTHPVFSDVGIPSERLASVARMFPVKGEGVLVGLLADGEQCKLLKLHKAGDGAVDDG